MSEKIIDIFLINEDYPTDGKLEMSWTIENYTDICVKTNKRDIKCLIENLKTEKYCKLSEKFISEHLYNKVCGTELIYNNLIYNVIDIKHILLGKNIISIKCKEDRYTAKYSSSCITINTDIGIIKLNSFSNHNGFNPHTYYTKINIH